MSDRPQNPPSATERPTSRAQSASAATAPPYTVLGGDYELRREIGRGGMGTVFEAWQRSLKRTVAVKVLHRQVSSSPNAVLRFQREAQAAAKLHHAHIIPIFALGEESGIFYYAMEFVDGPGLNALIAERRRRGTAGPVTADLADTVVLRRDGGEVDDSKKSDDPELTQLLPGQGDISDSDVTLSILSGTGSLEEYYNSVALHIASIADALDYAHTQGVIHRDIKPHNLILGSDGKLRISDFGLARLSEQPGVTITGELIGSPLYMSPEQLGGDPSRVDHRTDIYSLGATMYEWLTVNPPYPGDTRERVISQVLTSEPVPPRQHNQAIPPDLETICLKAMERDIERRYQTAGELRDDLERFLSRQPIRARRSGPAARMRKFVRRHQLASLGAIAVLLAVVLSAALVAKQRQVKTQTAAVEEAKAREERLVDLISSMLPPEFGGSIRVAEAVAPVLQDVVRGGEGMLRTDGRSQSGGPDPGAVSQPLRIAERAVWDFYEAVAPPADDPLLAYEEGDDAGDHLAQGVELARTHPLEALRIIDAVVTERPEGFEGRRLRAALRGRLGQYDRMLEDVEELVRLGAENPLAYAWRGLACLLLNLGERSIGDFDRAVALDGSEAWFHALRGLALAHARRPLDAIFAFDEALKRHPELVVALLGRAAERATLGNDSGAVADLTHVLEIEPDNADVLAYRGDRYLYLKEFAAAERDFEEAMKIAGRNPLTVLRYFSALSQRHNVSRGGPDGSDLPQQDTEVETGAVRPKGRSSDDRKGNWFTRLLDSRSNEKNSSGGSSLRAPGGVPRLRPPGR